MSPGSLELTTVNPDGLSGGKKKTVTNLLGAAEKRVNGRDPSERKK